MKNIVIALLVCSTYAAFAQIDIRSSSAESVTPKPLGYDSLLGVVDNVNPQKYVGQELYFIPRQLSGEPTGAYGYRHIYQVRPNGYMDNNRREYGYKPIKNDESNSIVTEYKAVGGKYYTITEVIDKTKLNETDGGGLYLKLQDKQTKEDIYLKVKYYDSPSDWKYSEYVLVGAFVKLQQLYKGNYFYINRDNMRPIKDIKTKAWIPQTAGDKWQCTDVTFVEDGASYLYKATLFFKNAAGNEVAYQLDPTLNMNELADIYMSQAKKDLLAKQQATTDSINAIKDKEFAAKTAKRLAEDKAAYIKEYGEKNGTLIANGQVVIGMTKEMCVAAWGRPTNVNTTTTASGTRDQYVYRDKNAYLYFENGKLVTIQK